MSVETRKVGKIQVLHISGELKMGKPVEEMRTAFKSAIENGERLFVFDMLKVPWLDSSGIGEVVACYKRSKDAKGELKVVMKGKSHDLFTFYELHKVCELHETLEHALGSFAQPDYS